MTEKTIVIEPTKARAELEELIPRIRNQEISKRCAWLLSQIVLAGGIASERDFKRLYPGQEDYKALAWLLSESLQHDWEAWESLK